MKAFVAFWTQRETDVDLPCVMLSFYCSALSYLWFSFLLSRTQPQTTFSVSLYLSEFKCSVHTLLPVFPLLFLLYCIVFTVAIDLIVHHISEIVQTNAGNTTNGAQVNHIAPGYKHETHA